MNLKPGKTLLRIFSKEFDYFLVIIASLFKLLKYELLREIRLLFIPPVNHSSCFPACNKRCPSGTLT